MRISDWSSDVCSSDLSTTSASSCSWEPNESTPGAGNGSTRALAAGDPDDALAAAWTGQAKVRNVYLTDDLTAATEALAFGRASCRECVFHSFLISLVPFSFLQNFFFFSFFFFF